MLSVFDIDPIRLLVGSAIVNGVISVPIMVVLMLIGQSTRLLGTAVISRRHPRLRLGGDRGDGGGGDRHGGDGRLRRNTATPRTMP